MKHRALVVEDDPKVIDQIVEVLESLDHAFDTACSQAEAIRRIREGRYSYVLTDVDIPARTRTGTPWIQNTVNLVEQVVDAKGKDAPPVIVISDRVAGAASLTVEMMRLAMDLRGKGVADVIEKPFSMEGRTLDRVIKKTLGPNGSGRVGASSPAPGTPAKDDNPPAAPRPAELQPAGELCDGREWLTVTQAAELLMGDLPALDLRHARARVSVAAARGEFATNERPRRERRIEKHSFSTWRLKQRDRDLDEEDEEAA